MNNHICVPVSDQILRSAKDFGLGKCKIIVSFELKSEKDNSLIDKDSNYLISSKDIEGFIKEQYEQEVDQ